MAHGEALGKKKKPQRKARLVPRFEDFPPSAENLSKENGAQIPQESAAGIQGLTQQRIGGLRQSGVQPSPDLCFSDLLSAKVGPLGPPC